MRGVRVKIEYHGTACVPHNMATQNDDGGGSFVSGTSILLKYSILQQHEFFAILVVRIFNIM
jgi:hypothetical protein